MSQRKDQNQDQNQDQKRHDAYNLRAIFEAIELDLIQNLRRNMKRHEKEEEKEGFRWEMWQKAKLRNLWKYRKQNQEIVGQHSKEIEDLINNTLQESFETAESMISRLFSKIKSLFERRGMQFPRAVQKMRLDKTARLEDDFFGVNEKKIDALQETAQAVQKPDEPPPEPKSVPEDEEKPFKPAGEEKDLSGKDNDQKLDDLKKQVAQDMKEVQGAIWRRMDDIYRQTIYKAEMFMATGAKTLDQAIDMATKEFLDGGIDCIQYRNGRRVNIASYAEMALRTASQRAIFLAEGKKRDEWGIHTIFVSAHANTCPKCEPWQGKVLVDDVFSHGTAAEADVLGVPLLSMAMKAGLLHPNCRHTLATYFPDITILPKVPDGKKAVQTYEAEQKQRALERMIRKWKRIAAGTMEQEKANLANDKVREYQEKLRDHLLKHPELRRDPNREKVRT
ncbi:phage minor capsid protein [Clostridium sp. FS41]|uniref:phage minor capsid protein n=1 Tax=Clostridium sp. FS41 TaxID=1609975 RepID=UPI0005D3B16D|nr:phage minor capsid protein [Clostridium sp. FS41]KJJ66562.1 phage minor capsid protein 2 [Clostridium sp. FS41]